MRDLDAAFLLVVVVVVDGAHHHVLGPDVYVPERHGEHRREKNEWQQFPHDDFLQTDVWRMVLMPFITLLPLHSSASGLLFNVI